MRSALCHKHVLPRNSCSHHLQTGAQQAATTQRLSSRSPDVQPGHAVRRIRTNEAADQAGDIMQRMKGLGHACRCDLLSQSGRSVLHTWVHAQSRTPLHLHKPPNDQSNSIVAAAAWLQQRIQTSVTLSGTHRTPQNHVQKHSRFSPRLKQQLQANVMRLTGLRDALRLMNFAATRCARCPLEPMRGLAACMCAHLRMQHTTSVLLPECCLWVTVP